MFKALLATFALCACASFTQAAVSIYGSPVGYGSPVYGPSLSYGPQLSTQLYNPASSYSGIALPSYNVPAGYPLPSLADYQIALGSNAEAAALLGLAISLPQPSGPIVGTNIAYQGLPYGPSIPY